MSTHPSSPIALGRPIARVRAFATSLTRLLVSILPLVWLTATGASPARAADELARLTVELEVRGQEQRRHATSPDHADGRFDDRYRLSIETRTSGELVDVNVKDPLFAERMMEMAARVQAAVAAGGAAWDESSETSAEPRFLDYFGFDGCATEARVTIDRRLTGAYGDVQGMVPYTITRAGESAGDGPLVGLVCVMSSFVLDVKDGVFYSDGIALPAGTATRTQDVRGRATERSEIAIAVQSEIAEWVSAQLRQAPVQGERRATLILARDESGALSAGDYTGTAEVVLRWHFERLGPAPS